jgi:Protein of unknown function DUF262/HNH endonuclease
VNVELHGITVRDLAEAYEDNDELGVRAYGGKLDVRPPYQREFIYKDKQRDAVIDTVTKGFPLNVMYWAVRDDGNYEVIDGQQRTISLCQYVEGEFAYAKRYFHNLQEDEQDRILDYPLMVYLCSGTDSERLEWFKTINIAGEELTDQELRNAVYSGSWVTDAKRYFSKTGCPAYAIGGDYMSGAPIRQDYLQTVIKWINDGDIEGYMGKHQHDAHAKPLWDYFQSVIEWVQSTFPTYRKPMKSVPWGALYNQYKDEKLNPARLEKRISELVADDELLNNKGIYLYVLDGQEKHLSLRTFSDAQKLAAYERQKGICPLCGEHFELSQMHADHILAWSNGGKTVPENCQMLCTTDNIKKSNQ